MRPLSPLAVAGLACLAGCPSTVDDPRAEPVKQAPAATEKDERVARDGEDLYPKKVLEKTSSLGRHEPPVQADGSPGTGQPDETNGTCRLYAPKLKNPECCKGEFGLDVVQISEACGLPVYLGESFQHSCGYYFHRPGDKDAWFRMSTVPGENVASAVESHDNRMKRLMKDDSFASKPVPGVDGAFWSTQDGLAWAFLPGWENVRQLAWRPEFCDDEKMFGVIKQITSAGEPAPQAKRVGMVPRARPPTGSRRPEDPAG